MNRLIPHAQGRPGAPFSPGMAGQKGATLSELLIATVIFGFLTMILLGVINFGSNSWRNLEGRSTAQKEARTALLELTRAVKNTDVKTFTCGNRQVGGKSVNWMCFKTAQAIELYKPELQTYLETYADGTARTGDKRLLWTNFILFYAIQPSGCGCAGIDSYADNRTYTQLTGEYYRCPHKLLIKKFLRFRSYPTPTYPTGYNAAYSGTDNAIEYTDKYLTITEIEPYLTTVYRASAVGAGEGAIDKTNANSVKLVCRNVLVFAVNFYDPLSTPTRGDSALASPQVQFTIKNFKIMENRRLAVGSADLNIGGAPTSLSIQVDEKIVPLNNNADKR